MSCNTTSMLLHNCNKLKCNRIFIYRVTLLINWLTSLVKSSERCIARLVLHYISCTTITAAKGKKMIIFADLCGCGRQTKTIDYSTMKFNFLLLSFLFVGIYTDSPSQNGSVTVITNVCDASPKATPQRHSMYGINW